MEAAKIYFIVFGVLTILGGIVGYLKAGSVASIIAGSITGVLLLVAAFVLPEHRMFGLAIALIVSLLLAAQFISRFLQTGSQISADRKSHACWNNVGPERNWGHCGHRRLGKKVIAWEEFAFGRGDGLCLSYSPRFSLRLFTAGYHSSGYNASRPLSYLPRQHRNRRQPGRR